MASAKRKAPAEVGSYAREYLYTEKMLSELLTVEHRARAAMSRAWSVLRATTSASAAFREKQRLQDVLSTLSDTIKIAETTASTSVAKLEALPFYGSKTVSHRLAQKFRDTLEDATHVRRRLIRAAFGQRDSMLAALESPGRDRSRPRPRRFARDATRDARTGKLCPVGTEIQSLVFSPTWTEARAKAWAKRHGLRYGKTHRTSGTLRLRQAPPEAFAKDSLRTITLRPGIRAVIGCPK